MNQDQIFCGDCCSCCLSFISLSHPPASLFFSFSLSPPISCPSMYWLLRTNLQASSPTRFPSTLFVFPITLFVPFAFCLFHHLAPPLLRGWGVHFIRLPRVKEDSGLLCCVTVLSAVSVARRLCKGWRCFYSFCVLRVHLLCSRLQLQHSPELEMLL